MIHIPTKEKQLKMVKEVELLEYIDPGMLNYSEWVSIGMALKHAGATASDWDEWSRRDPNRYHSGECFTKWGSFQEDISNPVTAGTLVNMAKNFGWEPPAKFEHKSLDWDSEIGRDHEELKIIDKNWIEGQEVHEPLTWEPHKQLIQYLSILFEGDDNVGYVTESWKKDDKFFPTKGCWDRTACQLIEALNNCDGDIGAVIGDCKEEVGAWIRFNPLDGQGVRNDNVADYRYALIESDETTIDKQNAIVRELELPVACLVHSGKKSIHAIVRIDADTYDEYRKRVDYLYDVCGKNGLKVDTQNRNPSRLSRMPGVMRNGHKQFLVDTNIGKKDWDEWKKWIEDINDDLPEPESLTSVWDNLPELSPPLIEGLLRQGHKMLLAGPSKAGKSYSLIELCIAIAEGSKWLQWDCNRGKILYVNLELDRASCLHRFKSVYEALGLPPDHIDNIDIWNLRGKAVPMDKLAPKLIRRSLKKRYIAIVIDPIYKVITGDENSADQMAHFCNQFDRICTELNSAVIYCHHHSKGTQGQKKSMDRASGSGVFARDPDALVDLIELDVSEALATQQENSAICDVCIKYLNKHEEDELDKISQDVLVTAARLLEECEKILSKTIYNAMLKDVETAKKQLKHRSAWRMEGTLREFPKFAPVNFWFDYPIHRVDTSGVLKDAGSDGDAPPWKKAMTGRKSKQDKKKERKEQTETAFVACVFDGPVTIESMAEYMDVTDKTVRSRLKEHGEYIIENNIVSKKDEEQEG